MTAKFVNSSRLSYTRYLNWVFNSFGIDQSHFFWANYKIKPKIWNNCKHIYKIHIIFLTDFNNNKLWNRTFFHLKSLFTTIVYKQMQQFVKTSRSNFKNTSHFNVLPLKKQIFQNSCSECVLRSNVYTTRDMNKILFFFSLNIQHGKTRTNSKEMKT